MDGGAKRRRREFIRAHHPDRGGDPEVFMAGLRRFDAAPEQPKPEPLPRVVVIVRHGWLIRLITALTQWVHPADKVPRVR